MLYIRKLCIYLLHNWFIEIGFKNYYYGKSKIIQRVFTNNYFKVILVSRLKIKKKIKNLYQ